MSLSQKNTKNPGRRAAKVSAILMLQSIPLALVLFIFFPRVSPFLSLDASMPSAQTGLSDQMTPGDVSALSQSNALAFRAEFKGAIPSAEKLYWRSLVLSRFDGRTWSLDTELIRQTGIVWQARSVPNSISITANASNPPIEYSVMLEPTQKQYLVGLEMPVPLVENIGVTRDFNLLSRQAISALFKYDLVSFLNYQLDTRLPEWVYRRETELPIQDDNVRSRALAQQWLAEAQGDPTVYMNHILTWFRQDKFIYTLAPGILPDHTIDRFLFDTKSGFCAHYASAFVYLLRAAGIPARMVVGYQGGELNPLGHYVLVHSYDAHAWAEVWLEHRGWVRVDPTSFVAPERIVRGAASLIGQQENNTHTSLLEMRHYWSNPWIRKIRLSLDYVNYAWDQNIVGYNKERQEKLLSDHLHLTHTNERIAWMMGLLMAIISLVAAYLFYSKSSIKINPLDQAYLRFCQRMAGLGFLRKSGETPQQFCQRIQQHSQQQKAELSSQVIQITDLYMDYQYRKRERRKKNQQAIAQQMIKLMRLLP